MALNSNFDVLLKEHNNNDLLINEVTKLNWLMQKLKKDTQWSLGDYQIPIETTEASRMEWGALPAANDIPLAAYAKPKVSSPKELLGSMIFDQKDLERHNGDMKKSFLSILPQKVRQFAELMNEQLNLALLGDGSICALTANGTVGGLVTVGKGKIGYFRERMKITIDDNDSSPVSGYVRNIDVNAGTFVLYNAATGGAVVDISTYTTAQAAKVFLVGAQAERCTSLVDIIFSAANGGADSLYGGSLVKSASPVFQPYFSDISAATTGANFLSGLYDVLFEVEEMGRSSVAKEVLLPFHAFKAIAKATETYRNYEMGKVEASYGSSSVTVTGPHGVMKVRAARGVPNDKAMLLDYTALIIASRGELIKKANSLSTQDYFEIRNTTGYQYICDKKAEFELIVTNPQKLGGLKIATSIT